MGPDDANKRLQLSSLELSSPMGVNTHDDWGFSLDLNDFPPCNDLVQVINNNETTLEEAFKECFAAGGSHGEVDGLIQVPGPGKDDQQGQSQGQSKEQGSAETEGQAAESQEGGAGQDSGGGGQEGGAGQGGKEGRQPGASKTRSPIKRGNFL
jgi:hypothetical protein